MKTMSNRGVLGSLGLLAVLTLTAGSARAAEVKGQVPFPFTVDKTTLPAGTYTISTNHSILVVRGDHRAVMVTSNAAGFNRDGSPRLVFARYGSQYFLREVRMGAYTGSTLPTSRAERELMAQAGPPRPADPVVVAAR